MWGYSFGAWAMMVASTFTILPLRLATCFAASSRNTLLGAPFQRGSVFGKKWPMSARRARPGARRNRVHERVRVRMAVQALGVWNLNAAQDELASRDQLMNVVTDANVNHVSPL